MELVLEWQGLKEGLFSGFEVGFQDQKCSDFVHLFLAFLMCQLGLSEQPLGKCRSIAFIDEADGAIGNMIKPRSKIASLYRLLTLPAIAMDRQANHPSEDLIVFGQVLEMLLIERDISSGIRFERARPSSARIANRYSDPDRSVVNPSQPTGFRPIKLSRIGITQITQPSTFALKFDSQSSYYPHTTSD